MITKNQAQKICTACFVIILALTVILWCVSAVGYWQSMQERNDLELFSMPNEIDLVLFLALLLIGVLQEFVFYIAMHYFLANREYKTCWKSLLYAALFLVNLFVVVKEIAYILPWCMIR